MTYSHIGPYKTQKPVKIQLFSTKNYTFKVVNPLFSHNKGVMMQNKDQKQTLHRNKQDNKIHTKKLKDLKRSDRAISPLVISLIDL